MIVVIKSKRHRRRVFCGAVLQAVVAAGELKDALAVVRAEEQGLASAFQAYKEDNVTWEEELKNILLWAAIRVYETEEEHVLRGMLAGEYEQQLRAHNINREDLLTLIAAGIIEENHAEL